MSKNTKLKSTRKRVKVTDLAASKKKISGKEMKKVKGGSRIPAQEVLIIGATSKKQGGTN